MIRRTLLTLTTVLLSQTAPAATITGCDSGIRTDISTNLWTTLSFVDPVSTSGSTCAATGTYEIETDGGNAATASIQTGAGATAGVGLHFYEENQSVRANARTSLWLEFYIRKTDPTAANDLWMDFDMQVLTQHFTLIGNQPFNVSVRQREGTINLYRQWTQGGSVEGPVNDLNEREQVASLAAGDMTSLSGQVWAHADGWLNAVRLEAYVDLVGIGREVSLPGGGTQTGFGTASLALAVSASLHLPDGYEFEFISGVIPEVGAAPNIDSPLSAVPVPPAIVFLASALSALLFAGRCRSKITDLNT